MASAQRVKQDPLVTGEVTTDVCTAYSTTYKRGALITSKKTDEWVEVTDNRRFTPQPDRITLDLSEAEARAIETAMQYSSNSKARHIRFVVADALYSGKATQSSSAQDAACAIAPKDPQMGYRESSSLLR